MQAHPPSAGGCAQVSRDAPPPLPGGYTMGEKVFYTAENYTWDDSGDKVVHGQQGEVMGAAIGALEGKGVCLRFPGNTGNLNCWLTTVRRLRAAAASTTSACAPDTRRCPRPACVPVTAFVAAPQPSLHAQPLAPQPTARVRPPRQHKYIASISM